MEKPKIYSESNNKENLKSEKELADLESELQQERVKAMIEIALIEGQKCNEGQNAVIYSLDVAHIPQDIRDYIFGEEDQEMIDKYATKIIKVHGGITAEVESNNQRQAYDIIESQDEEMKTSLAKVPKVHVDTSIEIVSSQILDKLSKDGVKPSKGQLEVFIMDYIKGDDLVTHLFKRLLEEMPDEEITKDGLAEHIKRQLKADPEQVTFEEIHSSIQSLLKLEQVNPLAEQDEMLKMDGKNREKVFDALKQYGVVLDKEILTRLENTLKLFHDNNLYHNDLHERNVMVEFDDDGNLVDVYVIDFDKASNKQEEDLGSDRSIVDEYTALTKTTEERKKEVIDKDIQSAQKITDRVKNKARAKWINLEKEIDVLLDNEDNSGVRNFDAQISLQSDEIFGNDAWQLVGGVVLELAKKDPQKAIKYIDYKIEQVDTPVYLQTLLRRIKSSL